MLSLQNVVFHYAHSEFNNLNNISVNIPQGIFCGIVGPNGSGKTTLLSVITRKIANFSGTVLLKGQAIETYSPLELAKVIAVVPQSAVFRFPYTCLELVLMGRSPYQRRPGSYNTRDIALAENAMRLTDTLSLANRPITELSGGERQRVVLAKALAQEPEILILDEAFANMDVKYSLQMLQMLNAQVKNQGLTVISVMHDLHLVSCYSGMVIMLSKGELIGSGPASQILSPSYIQQVFGITMDRVGEKGLVIVPD